MVILLLRTSQWGFRVCMCVHIFIGLSLSPRKCLKLFCQCEDYNGGARGKVFDVMLKCLYPCTSLAIVDNIRDIFIVWKPDAPRVWLVAPPLFTSLSMVLFPLGTSRNHHSSQGGRKSFSRGYCSFYFAFPGLNPLLRIQGYKDKFMSWNH